MPSRTKDMNMMKLMDMFPHDEACREVLEEVRWPDGVSCPRCESTHIRKTPSRAQYDCGSCGYQFSVISGTILHDTHLSLRRWMVATYLIVESKKGISANQMKRVLGVSYKTAWYLCHRIRAAMSENDAPKLSGTVEIDETWVGGRKRGVGSGNRVGKTMVLGAVERDGEVRMSVVSDRKRRTLTQWISENIDPATPRIMTDEWGAYPNMNDTDTVHERVNHFLREYVRGDVHTNTIESVWSLLKRSIIGSFHHVSEKHLDAYLDELEWRYNNRDNPWLFRDTLKKLLTADALPYQMLVS